LDNVYNLLIPYEAVVSAVGKANRNLLLDICDNISHKELINAVIMSGSIPREVADLKRIVIEVVDAGTKNYREYIVYRLYHEGLLTLNQQQIEQVTKALSPDWLSIKLDEYFNMS